MNNKEWKELQQHLNRQMETMIFELLTRLSQLENEVATLKEKVNAPVGGYGTFGKGHTIPEEVTSDRTLGESLGRLKGILSRRTGDETYPDE